MHQQHRCDKKGRAQNNPGRTCVMTTLHSLWGHYAPSCTCQGPEHIVWDTFMQHRVQEMYASLLALPTKQADAHICNTTQFPDINGAQACKSICACYPRGSK